MPLEAKVSGALEGVLGEIVERKRADVAQRKAGLSYERLIVGLERSERSLEAALRAPRTGFVCEVKAASPSRGPLRPGLDPARVARGYAAVADAISVITDAPYFQGDLSWLARVREAVAQPVLCKDFVVEPYQVAEARARGADAVLLMLSVLDDASYRACALEAERWGLDALTEVHDEAELARALALEARIVGVNNRDLKTLRVDLATSERLIPQVRGDRVVVSESGLFTHADARRLRGLADAFLVGTSLIQAPDPGVAARELCYGRVKVCGLTRPADAWAAWRAGASWGGLIFAPASPRCVSLEVAAQVRRAAPLSWAGVFVDAPPGQVLEHAERLELSAVQLHGSESLTYAEELRAELPEGCELWKALRVGDRLPDLSWPAADRVLLDCGTRDQPGGTGRSFDWGLLEGPEEEGRWLLAGGLRPDNAAEADRVASARSAWALDVNSGVEASPGIKDPQRLRAFFAALRGRKEDA